MDTIPVTAQPALADIITAAQQALERGDDEAYTAAAAAGLLVIAKMGA